MQRPAMARRRPPGRRRPARAGRGGSGRRPSAGFSGRPFEGDERRGGVWPRDGVRNEGRRWPCRARPCASRLGRGRERHPRRGGPTPVRRGPDGPPASGPAVARAYEITRSSGVVPPPSPCPRWCRAVGGMSAVGSAASSTPHPRRRGRRRTRGGEHPSSPDQTVRRSHASAAGAPLRTVRPLGALRRAAGCGPRPHRWGDADRPARFSGRRSVRRPW